MTKELRKAIEILLSVLTTPAAVLEVGSLTTKNQEELADLRPLFPKSKYVGVDMRKGPGVDVVANGEELPFKKNAFELVLCLETLEHAKEPWKVAAEIARVTAKGGVAIISSQQNFPIHMHPADYFRYTPYGLSSLFPQFSSRLVFAISPPYMDEVKLNPQHVLVVLWNGRPKLATNLKTALKRREAELTMHKPYRHRLQDGWKYIRRGLAEAKFHQALSFFSTK